MSKKEAESDDDRRSIPPVENGRNRSRSASGSVNGEKKPSRSKRTRSKSISRSKSRSESRSRSRSRSRKHKKKEQRKRRTRSSSRSASRSRSRSRSPSRSRSQRHKEKRRSRTRSRSRSRRSRGSYQSSRGYAPVAGSRYPKDDGREQAQPSRVLGVFGMSLYTSEKDLNEYFGKFGRLERVQLVYDHPTGRSRGFGFVTFENKDDAIEARDKTTGMDIDGHKVRVDFSVTKRAHTPTPGVYMGRPSQRSWGTSRGFRDRYDDRDYGRGRRDYY